MSEQKVIKPKRAQRMTGSDRTFDFILMVIVTLVMLVVLYPIVYVISSSLSSGSAVSSGRVILWPVDFSLEGYRIIFANQKVWTGYANSILYAVVTTFTGVAMTVMIAYPLSRKDFGGKKFLDIYFLILMFFGGGIDFVSMVK